MSIALATRSHCTEPTDLLHIAVSRYHSCAAGLAAFAAVAGVLVIPVPQSHWNRLFAQRFQGSFEYILSTDLGGLLIHC